MARWMGVVVVVAVVALDHEREVEAELVVVVGRARRCCRTPVFHADTPTLRMMLHEVVVVLVVVVVCETVSINNHNHKNQQQHQQVGTVNKGIRRILPVVPSFGSVCVVQAISVWWVYGSWSLVRSVEELSRHVWYYTCLFDEGDKRTKWRCCSLIAYRGLA
jgi:hypothetical protein